MKSIDLFDLTSEEKTKGIWLYGIEGEGKYRNWYENSQLAIRCFYEINYYQLKRQFPA
jgi:hypothetical protein